MSAHQPTEGARSTESARWANAAFGGSDGSAGGLDQDAIKALAAELAPLIAKKASTGLIDADAAGELLGVPSSWMLAEARAERVPHLRLGRYVRFDAGELLAWARERARGPRTGRRAGSSPVSGAPDER